MTAACGDAVPGEKKPDPTAAPRVCADATCGYGAVGRAIGATGSAAMAAVLMRDQPLWAAELLPYCYAIYVVRYKPRWLGVFSLVVRD